MADDDQLSQDSGVNPSADTVALTQEVREALAAGRLDLAEAAFSQHARDQDTLIETLRIYEAELRVQNQELCQSQTRIEETLARFTAFFDTLPIAELIIDARGFVLEANAAASELLALHATRLRRHPLIRRVAEQDRARVTEALNTALDTRMAALNEVRVLGANGETVVADLHLARLPDGPDQTPQCVCALVDRREAVAQRAVLQLREQALTERIKELDCLYAVAKLKLEHDAPADGVLQRIAERLPGGMQAPQRASACIELADQRFASPGFAACDTRIEAAFSAPDGGQGRVQVVYSGPQTKAAPAFLPEEQALVAAVAGHVETFLQRRHMQAALRESEERLSLTLEATNDGLWDWDVRSGELTVNERFWEMLGLAPGELEPRVETVIERFHPDDRDAVVAALERHISDGTRYDIELRVQCKSGQWRWIHARGRVVARDDSGEALRVVGTNTDIDVRKRAEERLRRAAQVFKSTADGVIITDSSHQILAVNPAFTEITGYAEAEVVGAPLTQLQINAGREEVFAGLRAHPGQSGRWRGEVWKRRKDGEPFRARMAVTGVTSTNGDPAEYVIVFSDITRLHRTEEQLDLVKNFDELTGLANRGQFRIRLQQALQRARRSRSQLAVLILDLDRFRAVNETLGQASADQLLVLIASALTRALRPNDTLARLGGDEFGLILEPVENAHQLAGIATRLLELCAEPKTVESETLVITASIGVALYPTDGKSSETLMRHADVALKQGKEQGRQSLQYFESALAQSVEQRLRLESGLRRALARQELALCYQPQVHLATRRIIGAEALLRWKSEDLGAVSPLQFIPIAEELGLIGEIGLWALTQACEQLAAWDAAGRRLPKLAVNLSTLQLEQSDLIAEIQRIIERTSLDPARLELEITESLIMRQADRAIATLNALRRLGVRLAVDDFGTGYSSLAYLRRLPLHQLKIDRSFVEDLTRDTHSQAIASAVIALGSSLDLEVIAEGVETAEQADWLLNAGCELGQGYLFDKALSAADLAQRWLTEAAATHG